MEGAERLAFLATIRRMLGEGLLTPGQALRVLRARWLGMSRPGFAQLVQVSPRALAQIESDAGNPTVQTLNQVFRPFGLQVGLVGVPDPRQAVVPLAQASYEGFKAAIQAALARRPRASGGVEKSS
jgi:DNA-binding XRE family transcriptional regulator